MKTVWLFITCCMLLGSHGIIGQSGIPSDQYRELTFDSNLYEGRGRDRWQKPYTIIRSLGDLSRLDVAEIGSGTGYMIVRLLPYVKTLTAVDVNRSYLAYVKKRVHDIEKSYPRLKGKTRFLFTGYTNPGLKPGSVDVIFMVNTFHHLRDRAGYLKQIRKALRPGGRFVLIDFNNKERPFGPSRSHVRLTKKYLISVLKSAGFSVKDNSSLLEYQHFLVGTK